MPKKKRNNRKVKNPVLPCAKGKFLVIVQGAWKGDAEDKSKHLISGMKVKLTGPQPVGPKDTDKFGQVEFTDLKPGGYTAEIQPAAPMLQKYDLDPLPSSQSDSVTAQTPGFAVFTLPFHKIAAEVYFPNDKLVRDIGYLLRRKRPNAAAWEIVEQGTLKGNKIAKEYIPRGVYEISLKLLEKPTWQKTPVIIDEAVEIRVRVHGFPAGKAGTFTIFDARDYSKVLDTVNATVTESHNEFEMKVQWTATKAKLAALKRGAVVCQAKIDSAEAYSAEAPVFLKTKYEVVDEDGTKLDSKLQVVFASGHTADADAKAGEAEILEPFGQEVRLIKVGAGDKKLVDWEGATPPTRMFRG